MKKQICLLIAFLLIGSLFGCGQNEAASSPLQLVEVCGIVPQGSGEVVEESDAIVRCKVIKTQVLELTDRFVYGDSSDEYLEESTKLTMSTVEVEEVLKGQLQKGEQLIIVQRGDGVTLAYSYIMDDCGYFKKDDTLLLFLTLTEDDSRSLLETGGAAAASYIGKELWIQQTPGAVRLDQNGNILQQGELFKQLFDNPKTLQDICEKME